MESKGSGFDIFSHHMPLIYYVLYIMYISYYCKKKKH